MVEGSLERAKAMSVPAEEKASEDRGFTIPEERAVQRLIVTHFELRDLEMHLIQG